MQSIIKKYIPLNKKIKLFFNFDNCIVETVDNSDNYETKSEYGFLVISIILELKSYESLIDAAAFSRPKYLNILGIVSFLIDEPINVFNSSSSQSLKSEKQNLVFEKTEKFIYEDIDKIELLNELICRLNKLKKYELSLIFSLLDRWRKAYHLENESEENFLYDDESTLSYFHVLELLGDIYAKQLKNNSDEFIKSFSNSYNSNILFLTDKILDSKNSETIKLLKSILNKDISVYSKIIYLLKEFNLYSIETEFWIKNLVDSRNSVAHGRRVYHGKAIYPIKPFYPLITNELYSLRFLRIFIAKVICSHLKIALFDEKWDRIKDLFITDDSTTKQFIKGSKIAIKNLSKEEYKIIFGGLNYFIVSKRIAVNEAKDIYRFYLESEIENKDFLATNIDAIVILYESNIQNMEKILKRAIVNTYEFDCNPHHKFRDMMYYLDYHNFITPKLESLIISNEIK